MKLTLPLLILTALIVSTEYYVLLWPLHRYMINTPGECRGYTTIYSSDWGSSRWDCMGNRHPDDRVGVQARTTSPEEDVVGDIPRRSRPEGWRGP